MQSYTYSVSVYIQVHDDILVSDAGCQRGKKAAENQTMCNAWWKSLCVIFYTKLIIEIITDSPVTFQTHLRTHKTEKPSIYLSACHVNNTPENYYINCLTPTTSSLLQYTTSSCSVQFTLCNGSNAKKWSKIPSKTIAQKV